MTKQEVFNFLNSGIDKSGYLKKETGFKKKFPELYDEFLNTQFPSEIENLPFKQKLWHFLNEDYCIPTCKICGNPVTFFHGKYRTYCCQKCVMKDNDITDKIKQTCIDKYGSESYLLTNEFKEKSKQTQLNLYGVENYRQSNGYKKKYKQTCLKKYGTEYSAQSDICKEKVRKTCLERYGSEYYVKTDEFQQKSQETCQEKYGVNNYSKTDDFKEFFKENRDEFQKRSYDSKKRNHSFNTSSIEEEFSEYLLKSNIKFNRQYKSDEYPFACDFYLPEYDLYIEIQGSWTHGWHPFNENDVNDIETLQSWKLKNKDYYNVAIDVWTIRDVEKRTTAKQNKLNYLEIFSNDLNECILQLKQKIESL